MYEAKKHRNTLKDFFLSLSSRPLLAPAVVMGMSARKRVILPVTNHDPVTVINANL